MKKLVAGIAVVEVIIIVILVKGIASKQGTSVNSFAPGTISSVLQSTYRNYFEPVADSVIEADRKWLPYKARQTINSDTLNDRYSYTAEKPKGVFRIITLGDSFTFGENVSTERNWTELLEDYLNQHHTCAQATRYEVINLGVPGYDTAYEAERYRLRGMKYNPDLVIWTTEDMYRLTDRIIEVSKTISADETYAQDEYIKVGKWEKAYQAVVRAYGKDKLFRYQIDRIKELRSLYYKDNPLLMVSLSRDEIEKSFSGPGIHFVTPRFQNDGSYFLVDGHFNDKGHRKMMEDIAGSLTANRLIPCLP